MSEINEKPKRHSFANGEWRPVSKTVLEALCVDCKQWLAFHPHQRADMPDDPSAVEWKIAVDSPCLGSV